MKESVQQAGQAFVVNAESLPLRQEDPLSLFFIFKTLGVLALLLLAVYMVLRWYVGRHAQREEVSSYKKMRCLQELRLSVKTRAYLLDVAGQNILVVDAGSSVSIVKIECPSDDSGG